MANSAIQTRQWLLSFKLPARSNQSFKDIIGEANSVLNVSEPYSLDPPLEAIYFLENTEDEVGSILVNCQDAMLKFFVTVDLKLYIA